MVNPLYQEVTRSRPIVKLFMATYLAQCCISVKLESTCYA